jgi:predicted GIY-YIG superfamily endonuclease
MASKWSKVGLANGKTKLKMPKSIDSKSKVKGSYKFEISGDSIPYPNKNGKTLYIGGTNNLYRRIMEQHLKGRSSSPSLQAYLKSKKRVYLWIKRAKGNASDKVLERKERNKHISEYGMKPICDNKEK